MEHTATTTDIVPVVMRWDAFGDGYHYVGPFGSMPEANEWAIEHDVDPVPRALMRQGRTANCGGHQSGVSPYPFRGPEFSRSRGLRRVCPSSSP